MSISLFKKKTYKNIPILSKERKLKLKLFTKRVGINFYNYHLLNLALTHRSTIKNNLPDSNNERLEFLGDSILGLSVTEHLYKSLPDKREGDLAKIKSYVVSEEVLSKIALNIKLNEFLLVGRGEEYNGGRKKNAILADALEALFGAYLLDRGYKKAKKFVLSFLIPEVDLVLKGDFRRDYKTIFQEKIQKELKVCPKYELVSKVGPDHDKVFTYKVTVNGESMGEGQGKTRKSAEQNAAKSALEYKVK